jgi:hypothetical protein
MFSSVIRYIIQLLIILSLLNILFATPESRYGHQPSSDISNQRSSDRQFRYAWFTRDIHDDDNEENIQQQLYRMKLLKGLFNQKYPDLHE